MSITKEGSFKGIFLVMIASMMIALLWNSVPFIKRISHAILDPTAGYILNWDLTYGMIILVFLISFFIVLTQKYATDQKTLKEMKKEQKILQDEMKKYKEHPEKMMEIQKKMFGFMPKIMKLSMRGVIYTAIPLILLFRWFFDFFSSTENPKFFGFFSWFWFYILGSIIFNAILRKIMKVV